MGTRGRLPASELGDPSEGGIIRGTSALLAAVALAATACGDPVVEAPGADAGGDRDGHNNLGLATSV